MFSVNFVNFENMKIRGFKLRKNRRYNYTPRYIETKDMGSPFDMGSKIRKYRDTSNSTDLSQNWKDLRQSSRNRNNREVSSRLLVIILVLVVLVMMFFEFDFSMFFRS